MGTVTKALGLLNILSRPYARQGLTEISKAAGYDKATTRRLLVELKANGFVEQDDLTRDYALGPALLLLGRAREERFPFLRIAQLTVEGLAMASGETAHASEYDAGMMNSVCSQQSDKSNRVIVKTGERLPLHATASGLAFLAASSPDFVEVVLRKPLEKFSANTLTDPAALAAIVEETRVRGYSLSNQLREEGVHSVAAAILNPRHVPIGAVAVAMPSVRGDAKKLARCGTLVREAANEISARLFGRTTLLQRTA